MLCFGKQCLSTSVVTLKLNFCAPLQPVQTLEIKNIVSEKQDCEGQGTVSKHQDDTNQWKQTIQALTFYQVGIQKGTYLICV